MAKYLVEVLLTCEVDAPDYDSAVDSIMDKPFVHYVDGVDVVYDALAKSRN